MDAIDISYALTTIKQKIWFLFTIQKSDLFYEDIIPA